MKKIEIAMRNIRYDIQNTIQSTFYRFIKENPKWYDNVDWNDVFTSYRFGLQSQQAVDNILELESIKHLLSLYYKE